jgi:hypothetical protein
VIREQLGRNSRRGIAESCFSIVMPRFKRGIQYAVTSRVRAYRLWDTGSPGQAGRRRQSKLFDKMNPKIAVLHHPAVADFP